MIDCKKLTKAFDKSPVVDEIDLLVNSGEIYGFLGPNGAGKTTTIRMLTGTLRPTSGEIKILGMNYSNNELQIKSKIGVVPEEPRIYSYFTGAEFLEFIMDVFPDKRQEAKKRVGELCEAFGIDYLGKMISEMSHGMKQKIMVISVLMRRPEVIFLDEPTVGLDARSAKILKMLLEKYKGEGSTIFMTTHVLEIAEKMCDRIGIINKGKLISEGTMDELRKRAGADNKETLENLFLQLTGENEDIQEIVGAL
ncbi:ABC transporter [Mesotoga sp. Brook.08.YT.4.2.5.1]|uniref:ABC transporter ATP-binding protein n=1 Tax=unclassified Mesotoga TaxID=1184398 RepID=UPI000C1A3714|nr:MULTISPECIES: ABC transporter ATP-binding protein [unclassified Mesotoga]RAM58339.1 ABC transporter [Mesotoga sp. SC_4PWL113PWK15]PNE23221.1 ABC transporter [Mesotoga sp. Brook.08.YT.4.2.5.1]PNS42654.1 ABC transporter [Mesotoga sp. B105.6.4]PVD17237.1 ABC transporter [Mesotoga sp. Brook.08.105.5.1]RAO97979.1 ABC transporter [Mesotoga sp. Brook.08.YT.4.2.5.4.]